MGFAPHLTMGLFFSLAHTRMLAREPTVNQFATWPL
jgi:hypothetical protein